MPQLSKRLRTEPSSSLELSICLVTKLLMFHEGCKESQGDSVHVSQNRAALFDMTVLMLVYMVQCFKSSVVL